MCFHVLLGKENIIKWHTVDTACGRRRTAMALWDTLYSVIP